MMTPVREQTTPTGGAPDRIGTVMRALARVRVLCDVRASGNGQTIEARALVLLADAITELVTEMTAVKAYAEEASRHRPLAGLPSGNRLRTVDEAADAVNCHPATVRRAYASGNLRVQAVGRSVRIHSKELARWCETGARTS